MLTQMIGQGGWDVYVTGVNGFVGKEHGQPLIIRPGYGFNNNLILRTCSDDQNLIILSRNCIRQKLKNSPQ